MTRKTKLSARQAQALWYSAHGMTCEDVGKKMGISMQTAKNLLYYARMKKGALNNAHLVFLTFASQQVIDIPVDNMATDVRRAE